MNNEHNFNTSCANGACFGSTGAFKKKHVGEVQTITPATIEEYLSLASQEFENNIRMKDRMKEIEISKKISSELLGRMFIDDAIITSTQLNLIKGEIELPSFNYNSDGSLWQLYNHTTHALKNSYPGDWVKNHIAVDEFFIKEYQLI